MTLLTVEHRTQCRYCIDRSAEQNRVAATTPTHTAGFQHNYCIIYVSERLACSLVLGREPPTSRQIPLRTTPPSLRLYVRTVIVRGNVPRRTYDMIFILFLVLDQVNGFFWDGALEARTSSDCVVSVNIPMSGAYLLEDAATATAGTKN